MVLNSNDNPNVNVGILNILLRAQTWMEMMCIQQ
jgi:hypothetical protein